MIDLFEHHDGSPLRNGPSGPVIRQTTEIEGDPPLRLVVTRIWNVNRPVLCWVLFRPVADERDTGMRRIIRWTYRGHFGGCIITALYPLVAANRTAVDHWRKNEELLIAKYLDGAAECAGLESRKFHVRTVVVATGDLDAAASDDLARWLGVFRSKAMRSKFRTLERTLAGWPAAPAISGRRRPPDVMTLVPWSFPVVTRPRRSLRRLDRPDPLEGLM